MVSAAGDDGSAGPAGKAAVFEIFDNRLSGSQPLHCSGCIGKDKRLDVGDGVGSFGATGPKIDERVG